MEYRSVTLERGTDTIVHHGRRGSILCNYTMSEGFTSVVLLRHILVASKRAPIVHIQVGTKECRIYRKGL